MLPEFFAGTMLVALILYALSGGADFGGGVFDLFATGPRKEKQRELIEAAIAPIWEANHVWLIFVIVVLFSAFPPAFSALSIHFHFPLLFVLLGITFRGSAFVFRHYGARKRKKTWGRVFAIASLLTPIFLGITIGGLTDGKIANNLEIFTTPFHLAIGILTLVLFAFLAAVYLTNETADPALQNDFRLRALITGGLVGVFAFLSIFLLLAESSSFALRFLNNPFFWPLQLVTGILAIACLATLFLRRYRLSRWLAILQVTFILLGWGMAQFPVLVPPNLTIEAAASPPQTLKILIPVLLFGVIVLFPCLYFLLRLFKRPPVQS